ncbi:MAG: pitrilysin family protein [Deltaproteobacteria bacterium]
MYNKTVLENGVRIISENIPHSRTVAVGIWVDAGSRDEHDLNNGCGHFVEHMLFKGTSSRSVQQIARELDVLGGLSNAFTSRENTCYYATVLDSHLPRVVDLLTDMFCNSLFDEEEVVRERQVILQEINMAEDMPDDQIHDHFCELLWGLHPLGKTVLGSREVVASVTRQKLQEHVQNYYSPERVVIAAAGNVGHEAFVDLCQQPFKKLTTKSGWQLARKKPTVQKPVQKVFSKPLEQIHAVVGTYGLSNLDEKRFALILLNIIWGGNMSSRLFQEIREKRGLAYSVYSFADSFLDSGYLGVYLGVDRETVNEAFEVIGDQLGRLREDRVSEQELRDAKDYAKGGLYLSAENMEARMTRNARNEYCFGRYISIDEVVRALEKVTAGEIRDLADKLFSRELSAAVLGPVKHKEINWRPLR